MKYRISMMVVMGILGLCAGCVSVIEIASPPERIEHTVDVGDVLTKAGGPRYPSSPRLRRTSCTEGGWIVVYRYVDYSPRRCDRLPRDPRLRRDRVALPRIQQGHWKSESHVVTFEERLRERRAQRAAAAASGNAPRSPPTTD